MVYPISPHLDVRKGIEPPARENFMKYFILAVRLILGGAFVFFSLNYFLHFYSMSRPEPTPAAQNFMAAIGPTGYMDAVKVIELTGGLLLLTGLMVPLGLVLLTPVLVNINFYDAFLMKQPGIGLPLLAMAILLIWGYRANFAGLFKICARPVGQPTCAVE